MLAMDLGIAGRTAVVTGATSGLGAAITEALAAEGVHLVLFARTAETLAQRAAHLVDTYGVEVCPVVGDMTVAADVERLAVEASRHRGADILVLNTPRPPSPMRNFLDEDDQQRWDDADRDQLGAALLVLRSVVPGIVSKGWGRVVGVTSASVKQPMPRHALSTIFRAGVAAALKHLAMEVGPHGVTVNCVAPATVVTPTFSAFHDLERRISELPLRRAGTVSELASTVAYLVSEPAGFITGQTIQVDGGMTLSLV